MIAIYFREFFLRTIKMVDARSDQKSSSQIAKLPKGGWSFFYIDTAFSVYSLAPLRFLVQILFTKKVISLNEKKILHDVVKLKLNTLFSLLTFRYVEIIMFYTVLEKLICLFFHSFHLWKRTTNQLFSSKFQCRKQLFLDVVH